MTSATDQNQNDRSNPVLDTLDSKIFLINRYSVLDSPYRWARDLLSILGERATLINLKFNLRQPIIADSGIIFDGKFVGLPYLNYLLRDIAFSNARKYIERVSRDIGHVIIHYTNQFSGVLNIPGVGDIVNVQDSPYYVENSSFIQRLYLRSLYNSLKKQQHIVTNTNHLKNELTEFGFEGEITTLYLPYSPRFRRLSLEKEALRKKLALPYNKKLVLSVSTDSARKNLQMVKKAVDELGSDFRLVRVGTPLGDSITFKAVDDESLNELYNACDVLLFPSLYEGFGLPIVEAFASGLPVVTSDIPTIREVAGDAAALSDPRNAEDIKDAIKFALNNSDNFAKKGIERSLKFSFDGFKKGIIALYKKIERENS